MLTDQRGKTVTLDGPAKRIVAIPMPVASMVAAIDGSADRLVGMNPSSATAWKGGLLGELMPAGKTVGTDIANDTFAPNVESIVALRPDLVIQWGDRGNEITDPLENAGLKVIGLRYGTQEDLETWIKLLGEAMGQTERAQVLLDWHRSARADVAKLPKPASRPKVLVFNRLDKELRVNGAQTYSDFVIDLVGGENAAAGIKGIQVVSAEQVAAWKPDVVIVGNFDTSKPADVYAVPAWRELPAVTGKRVYQAPLGGYRWDAPNQESPLMWSWLAALVNPGAPEPALRTEILDRYKFLYGAAPTTAQLDRVLRIDVNAGAAGYERVSGN